ncbi:MRPL35 [[Candida] subhashii]|uniref:Large ribosomal subunit protein mL38 n=1 Tax=[Candida] subhashii TaxID=561895 RepID=A0A8J5QIJ4_9ASCO|nr:MRPL35 [[Candida] subhashii]KAG7662698.1 MRPL35 [[Candida] subhashii]
MLTRALTKRFIRSNSTLARGVWADFSKRPESLKIKNDALKQGVLGKHLDGPASYTNRDRRAYYKTPLELDETFVMSYEILNEEAANVYKKVEELEKELASTTDEAQIKEIKDQIDNTLIEAEIQNPEVLFNVEYSDSDALDRSHPVYRQFLEQKWRDYDLMLTMQRLEQLHVIPDTLPTVDPKVDVKVKFTHNTDERFVGWIAPGELLPAKAVSQPPTIRIQEYERVDGQNLYTVLIVNPDTPDLEKNSFSTTLHYGLVNYPLDNVNNTIHPAKVLENEEQHVIKDYVPLVPEKNAEKQRACLWVFRQSKQLEVNAVAAEKFDIRSFVQANDLLPVGGYVWRQKFDRSVNEVRDAYGLGRGRVFHRVRGRDPLVE